MLELPLDEACLKEATDAAKKLSERLLATFTNPDIIAEEASRLCVETYIKAYAAKADPKVQG